MISRLAQALFVSLTVAPVVAAQAQQAAAEPSEPAASGLEDIVVTAQRRSENLQDVPISVQSLSASKLASTGITSIINLQQQVPSLVVNDFAGYILPFIRGVGSSIQGTGFYSSVATYVDGVYYSRLSSSGFDYDNIEQVQVLKGPQGALYGRNANGGALVYTTRNPKPGEVFGGRVSGTLGTYDARAISGSIWSGLGDNAGILLSGKRSKRDGFVKNLGAPTHNDDLDDENITAFSGKFVLKPAETLEVLLSASYTEHKDRAGTGWTQVSARDANGLNGAQLLYAGLAGSLGLPAGGVGSQVYSNTFRQTYDNLVNGFENGVLTGKHLNGTFTYGLDKFASAHVTKNFPTFDLKSISALFRTTFNSASGILGEAPGNSGIPGIDGTIGFSAQTSSKVFSQELQAASTAGDIQWVGGLYYFNERGKNALGGDAFGFSALSARTRFATRSKAAYGQVKIPLFDRVRLTAGLRYTDEDYSLTDLTPVSTIGSLNRSSSKLTESVILDYKVGNFLFYANFGTGFKSGNLNASNPTAGTAKPETLTSYELGFKGETDDRRLRINGAVFRYYYKDIQLQVINQGNAASFLVNGPKSKITGAEIEATALPVDNLTLHAAATLLDPKYDQDTPLVIGGVTQGVLFTKGKLLVGASKFAISGDATVDAAVPGGELSLTASGHYSSGYYFDPENKIGSGGATGASYFVANAELAYITMADRLRLSVAVDNVFNKKYYRGGVLAAAIVKPALPGTPRFARFTAKYNF